MAESNVLFFAHWQARYKWNQWDTTPPALLHKPEAWPLLHAGTKTLRNRWYRTCKSNWMWYPSGQNQHWPAAAAPQQLKQLLNMLPENQKAKAVQTNSDTQFIKTLTIHHSKVWPFGDSCWWCSYEVLAKCSSPPCSLAQPESWAYPIRAPH